jgi:hypothetical protein
MAREVRERTAPGAADAPRGGGAPRRLGLGLNLPNAAAGGIHLLLIAASAVAIAGIMLGRKLVVIDRRPHPDSVKIGH